MGGPKTTWRPFLKGKIGPPSRASSQASGRGFRHPAPAGWDSVRGLEPNYAYGRPGGRRRVNGVRM